jgi:beta-lactamase class A
MPVMLVLLGACHTAQPPPQPVQSLEATLQTLIARHPEATVAVAVRDPDGGHRLDLLSDRLFHAASTMKVPVMIEVYRQADLGRFSLDDSIQVVNAFRSIVDGSPYSMDLGEDSDESIYEQIGRPMSIRDLVYQMITVSSNLATNLLIDYVSADSVQATSERLGTARMQTLRGVEDIKAYERGLSNRATAADLATLLDALRRGTAVSPDADRAMVGVLLDQQFNTLIPAGLPGDVRVAHKTGSITEIHHDAAIVYPLDGPPYVLVVLTEGIADEAVSAALAADIAAAVHAAIRPR